MRKIIIFAIGIILIVWAYDAFAKSGQLLKNAYIVGMEDGSVYICQKIFPGNPQVVPLECQEFIQGAKYQCVGESSGALDCKE